MDNIKHFETLWGESEALVSKAHQESTIEEIIFLISELLSDYKETNASSIIPDEVKKSLKKRYMGEIIYLFSALSARDDINVYAALMEELKMNTLSI